MRRGLTASAGGVFRLPCRIPHHLAMEFILTGQHFGAERARELGLVNRLTAPGEALSEARKLAEVIAGNGPLAVAAAKQVAVESQDWPLEEAFSLQAPIFDAVRASRTPAKARAFAEKRPPVWLGR